MNKQEFQVKIKKLRNLGIKQTRIAKKIGCPLRDVYRANSNWYKKDSTEIFEAFERVFK